MVDWCVVIFQHPVALQAGCKLRECSNQLSPEHWKPVNKSISFAFVEYESRRDADDAYHEMHNKRLGRDDVLKIEVYSLRLSCLDTS